MSTALTPKSPLIYPSTVSVPDDSESLLWSGPFRTTLTQLADRTDYLRGVVRIYSVNGVNTTAGTGSFADVPGTTISLGALPVGAIITTVLATENADLRTNVRVVVNNGSDLYPALTIMFRALNYPNQSAVMCGYTTTVATTHTIRVQQKTNTIGKFSVSHTVVMP